MTILGATIALFVARIPYYGMVPVVGRTQTMPDLVVNYESGRIAGLREAAAFVRGLAEVARGTAPVDPGVVMDRVADELEARP